MTSAARNEGSLRRFVRRLFCRHDWQFARNFYGDEINLMNGRSWWVCYKCGAGSVRRELHTPNTTAHVRAVASTLQQIVGTRKENDNANAD